MEKAKNKQNKTAQNVPYKKLNKKTIELTVPLNDNLSNFVDKEKMYIIPIFIPHNGCKNECIFCNQRKISGTVKEPTFEEVDKIIQNYMEYFTNSNRKIEIAFFGGSFTGIDIKKQIGYLEVANKYVEKGVVTGIRVSTRPDYISNDILEMLKRYNVKTIELGVQSMDDKVLELSKRGHTSLDVERAARLINDKNINLGFQIMIGLYKSTVVDEVETMKRLLKFNPKFLRIYPVYVIPQSKLYDMYQVGEYIPLSLEESIKRTYLVVKECLEFNVKIIRVGLQSTEVITTNNQEIAGPVCDNFLEYVLAEFAKEKIKEKLDLIHPEKEEISKIDKMEIIIKTEKRNVSVICGPNKINKEYLKRYVKEQFQVNYIDIKIKEID